MKTYEQMAKDVLRRAQVYDCRQKRNRRIIVCVCSFGCLMLLLLINALTFGYWGKQEPPTLEQPTAHFGSQPTEDMLEPDCVLPLVTVPNEDTQQGKEPEQQNPETSVPSTNEEKDFGVVLLVASSPQDPGTELVENLTLPMNYFLRVRDLRRLSDDEREQAINEERAKHRKLMDESLNGASVRYGNCKAREDYVISFIRNGCFRLQIENYDLVESISVRCSTKYGQIDIRTSDYQWLKGWDVEIQPDDISDNYLERPLEINWKYTTELLYALDEDPAMPLSRFSDIVTFTVKFLDGTVKETKVQIIIQDDGQLVVSMFLQTDAV